MLVNRMERCLPSTCTARWVINERWYTTAALPLNLAHLPGRAVAATSRSRQARGRVPSRTPFSGFIRQAGQRLLFIPCIEPHHEREHFAGQFLWNFVAAAERLTYRSEHVGSRRFLRVGRPIRLVARLKLIFHGRNLCVRPSPELREGTDKWFLNRK
jgi:hypothetical protein